MVKTKPNKETKLFFNNNYIRPSINDTKKQFDKRQKKIKTDPNKSF